jgi:hypothetical protein
MLVACLIPLVSLTPAAARQQIQCTAVVKKAFEDATKVCGAVGRNKACLVNPGADAQPIAGKTINFTKRGDTLPLADLKTLRLSPYDEKTGQWGVVVMRVQASFPDNLPGQNVSMILMGNVEITPQDKLVDGSPAKPMQSFYLKSGSQAPACKEMPADGVLLETPKNKESVRMAVNGASLSIGSKVFLRTQPDQKTTKPEMVIQTLEGTVEITIAGITKAIAAGYKNEVPLNTEGATPTTDTWEDVILFEDEEDDGLPITVLDQLDEGDDGFQLEVSEPEAPSSVDDNEESHD